MSGIGAEGRRLLSALRMTEAALPETYGERIEALLHLEGVEATAVLAIAMGTAREQAGKIAVGSEEERLIAAALMQGMVLGATVTMLSVAQDEIRRNGGSL